MRTRGIFQWVAALGSFCVIILFFDSRYYSLLEYRVQPTSAVEESTTKTKHIDKVNIPSKEIWQHVIDQQANIIRHDMEGYQYPDGKYNISARRLEDLVINEDGTPIRSIILSTWRSGSSFLGALISAHPGNFYHFEPLLGFDDFRIRDPPVAAEAIERVRALLNCEYANQDEFLKSGKYYWAFNRNTQLWKQCKAHKSFCYDHKFLTAMCKLFPFQSMKLVRLRLDAAQELLADEKLGIRLVLLVRDPRGTVRSRKYGPLCENGAYCSDPALLCADLVSDYKTAVELRKKYPTTFRVIRYEELAADPYTQAEELYKFFGRNFHPNVREFLDTHTAADTGDQFDTSRNSTAAPFRWKTDLSFEEVEAIERTCSDAMEHWGYVPAMNATHQKEFNPVTDYVLK